MKMKPVKSSNVESVGYDPDLYKLFVKFRSGKTYEYGNVSAPIYENMMKAPSSVGKFVQQHLVRNILHPCKVVEEGGKKKNG